ncbi:MAG: hypothetical protein J3Q66DRAFT_363949 [Benniella sp.]|nr:MAG: hypothetical protein J3Q66DRAFT_363949 [Benniella sp.]
MTGKRWSPILMTIPYLAYLTSTTYSVLNTVSQLNRDAKVVVKAAIKDKVQAITQDEETRSGKYVLSGSMSTDGHQLRLQVYNLSIIARHRLCKMLASIRLYNDCIVYLHVSLHSLKLDGNLIFIPPRVAGRISSLAEVCFSFIVSVIGSCSPFAMAVDEVDI